MDPHAPQSEKDVLVDGWFSGGMPDLNQRNRHLATYLIQNSVWWIEYARIDGIRMDTYPYADYDFMTRWCQEIEDEYPDFNIVGEGWYPRNSAAGWWQRGSALNPSDTHLKTVMDFDLTFTIQREILKESNTSEGSEAGLFKVYETVAQDFLIPDPDHVLTFLDNHDISRFMQPGDPVWKFKQGLAFLATSRGIPQIYYGTEIAMAGPDQLRGDFPGGWKEDLASAFTAAGRTPVQNECWDFASKLLTWRRTSKAATEGRLVHYTPDNQTKCYVYARIAGDDTVLVILNGSDTERELNMARFADVIGKHSFGVDVVTGGSVDLTTTVRMAPRGVYVLELK
jgi:glycosidase